MDLLYWFQQIQNPVLDFIFENISLLVNQVVILIIICYLYWCYDKKLAQKIAVGFFSSGIVIQTIKIGFRIPRPWIIDSRIQPKEKMIKAATGYSFPSGHTQTATAICYGFLDRFKKNPFKYFLVIFPLLVMISRMYVRVHSPWDVSISFMITSFIIYKLQRFLNKNYDRHLHMICYLMGLLSIISFMYAYYLVATNISEYALVADCIKTLGASFGLATGILFEAKQIHFTVINKGFLKNTGIVGLGLLGALLFLAGIKMLLPVSIFTDFIRYFLTIFWIVYLYPFLLSKIIKVS